MEDELFLHIPFKVLTEGAPAEPAPTCTSTTTTVSSYGAGTSSPSALSPKARALLPELRASLEGTAPRTGALGTVRAKKHKNKTKRNAQQAPAVDTTQWTPKPNSTNLSTKVQAVSASKISTPSVRATTITNGSATHQTKPATKPPKPNGISAASNSTPVNGTRKPLAPKPIATQLPIPSQHVLPHQSQPIVNGTHSIETPPKHAKKRKQEETETIENRVSDGKKRRRKKRRIEPESREQLTARISAELERLYPELDAILNRTAPSERLTTWKRTPRKRAAMKWEAYGATGGISEQELPIIHDQLGAHYADLIATEEGRDILDAVILPEALAKLLVHRGKAKDMDEAWQQMNATKGREAQKEFESAWGAVKESLRPEEREELRERARVSLQTRFDGMPTLEKRKPLQF